MRRLIGMSLLLWCCFGLLCPPAQGVAEKDQAAKLKQSAERAPNPMVIKSDSLIVDNTKKVVTFLGRVNAKRDEFTIECDKMLVYYESSGTHKTNIAMGSRITKIIADGNVKITRKTGGEALAEHAEYYEGQDKIVLTGNPMVRQGEDFVQGDKITIFLKENRSIVESSPNKKVKAVIYPKREAK